MLFLMSEVPLYFSPWHTAVVFNILLSEIQLNLGSPPQDVNSYFSKSSLPHGLKKAIGGSPAEPGRLGTSGGMR